MLYCSLVERILQRVLNVACMLQSLKWGLDPAHFLQAEVLVLCLKSSSFLFHVFHEIAQLQWLGG